MIIMGNSLGYIQSRDADSQIMREAYRVLRPGGWLLADVTDGNVVKKEFTPNSWHEMGAQIIVCRQRELRGEVVVARELVLDKRKGLVRDRSYAIRLYDSESLRWLLQRVGFEHTSVHRNFRPRQSGGDCGFMSNRMIAVGQKV